MFARIYPLLVAAACLSFFAISPAQAASSYQGATKLGAVETDVMQCGKGAFWDPRNGGECWSCDGGVRTLFAVDSNQACQSQSLVETAKASLIDKDLGICPDGSFLDPRKGGECWSCPAGTKRTLHAVTDAKACSKRIKRVNKKAKYKYNTGSVLKACKKRHLRQRRLDQVLHLPQGL